MTGAQARVREAAAWCALTDPLRRRQDAAWATALELALRAVAALETGPECTELPRLANEVSGDAHGLDPDRAAGRMFERLLVRRHPDAGFSLPLSAEARESLFAMSRLAVDKLSSTVQGLTDSLERDLRLWIGGPAP